MSPATGSMRGNCTTARRPCHRRGGGPPSSSYSRTATIEHRSHYHRKYCRHFHEECLCGNKHQRLRGMPTERYITGNNIRVDESRDFNAARRMIRTWVRGNYPPDVYANTTSRHARGHHEIPEVGQCGQQICQAPEQRRGYHRGKDTDCRIGAEGDCSPRHEGGCGSKGNVGRYLPTVTFVDRHRSVESRMLKALRQRTSYLRYHAVEV